MKAVLVFHSKVVEDGAIFEIRIWKVAKSRSKPEGFKYSLVYIEGNKRIIGYDNSEGKGHHHHFGDKEEPYDFTTPVKLIGDFENSVREYKRKKGKRK